MWGVEKCGRVGKCVDVWGGMRGEEWGRCREVC